jgi:mRNA interferase HigB
MQVLGLIKLDAYKRSHANARGALDAWQLEVERSHWSGPQDVKTVIQVPVF